MKTDTRQSFSAKVKAELIRLPLGKACCMLSEISALTMTSGHLAFRGGGWISISYRLDDAGTARRLLMLLKKRLNVNPTDAHTLLNALHMAETDEDGQMHLKRMAPRHPMTRQCCRRAFLRGAYLGAGTMTNPEKGYHFEWKAEDEQLPRTLEKLLEKCEMPYRDYERKGTQVIYLKGAQHIADMLALMGAGQSVLDMETIRVGKQVKAAATRAANCDEHNGDKMLAAAQKQADAIRRISLKQGLFTLPPGLQEIARLRLDNPEMSLKELGELMDPPVGKSGVNHRMRRLMEILDGEDPVN